MSTPANIDFCVVENEVIDPEQRWGRERIRVSGPQSGHKPQAGRTGHGRSRDQGDLMDTMSVNVATLRSATSVAGARESARDFLDGLVPAIAAGAADTAALAVPGPGNMRERRTRLLFAAVCPASLVDPAKSP
ncbi:hypothetical protein ACFVU0_18295 [Streptomyces sp. NPDC058122]|uniref:hypothetical protein n=1 Tax=Streptomyces sp. NPDC058122 TaxID=3346349 RepID=UPI0036E7F61E